MGEHINEIQFAFQLHIRFICMWLCWFAFIDWVVLSFHDAFCAHRVMTGMKITGVSALVLAFISWLTVSLSVRFQAFSCLHFVIRAQRTEMGCVCFCVGSGRSKLSSLQLHECSIHWAILSTPDWLILLYLYHYVVSFPYVPGPVIHGRDLKAQPFVLRPLEFLWVQTSKCTPKNDTWLQAMLTAGPEDPEDIEAKYFRVL